jgi:hypothetical protein
MSNWAEAAFAESEGIYKAQVMAATWGHLDAKPGDIHKIKVLFCLTCYGEFTVIDYLCKTLQGGPGLYSHLNDFISRDRFKPKEGRVYAFAGTYRVGKKGQGIFEGHTKLIPWKNLR